MNEKLNRLIELNEKKKQLKQLADKAEKEYKDLQAEMVDEIKDDTTNYNGYVITKTGRDSYKLKEDVDEEAIKKTYPQATKIDLTLLYGVSNKPEDIIDVNRSEWFLIKQDKKVKAKEF
jgi:predicted transcriptional regulator